MEKTQINWKRGKCYAMNEKVDALYLQNGDAHTLSPKGCLNENQILILVATII